MLASECSLAFLRGLPGCFPVRFPYPFVAQPMIAEALGLTAKGLRDFTSRVFVTPKALYSRAQQ